MAMPKADLEVTIVADGSRLGAQTTNALGKFGREVRGFNTKLRRLDNFHIQKDTAAQAFKQVEKKLNAELLQMGFVLKRSMQKVANEIKNNAVAITPKDTGNLRKSAFAVTDKVAGKIFAKIGYNITSGPVPSGVKTGVDYAVLIHEDDSIPHTNGTSGFLRIAALEAKQKIANVIARDLRARKK